MEYNITKTEKRILHACYEEFSKSEYPVTFDWIIKELDYEVADCTLRRALQKFVGIKLLVIVPKLGQKHNANGYYSTLKGIKFMEYQNKLKL
jgi:hypothetical protein